MCSGIATYLWLVTNHKSPERQGKIQLINATSFFQKMRKSLGSKRKELGDADIVRIVGLCGDSEANDYSKIFDKSPSTATSTNTSRPGR